MNEKRREARRVRAAATSSASLLAILGASLLLTNGAAAGPPAVDPNCVPTPEVCDGLDNDCDGVVDNGNPGGSKTCTTGLPGVCSYGTTVCTGGALQCVSESKPGVQPEICDGLDNDCDGIADEGFDVGAWCTVGVGECLAHGWTVCNAAGGSLCNAVPFAQVSETCDGLDNDCDGVVDNGTASGGWCDTELLGICGNGVTACSSDHVESCLIVHLPGTVAEACNGLDDDCDGVVDEGFALGVPCTVGLGICAASGVTICDASGVVCSVPPGTPAVESCNGLDDNCDGYVDNDVPGAGLPCDTQQWGECRHGVSACTPFFTMGCTPLIKPHDLPEICWDLLDTDCDGAINSACVGDTDGDGLSDADEQILGTNWLDGDSDDDGVLDGLEIYPGVDSDGDGLINGLDPDSDDDGLFDGTEMGLLCNLPGTNAALGHCQPDADHGATRTDPIVADSDGGGALDGSEDINRNGVVDPDETDPNAGHGSDDSLVDSDADGLGDAFEAALGADPLDPDSDDDGLLDGDEANPADDTDGDGLVNLLDPDSDGDGLSDGTERGTTCSDPATDPAAAACTPDADAGATRTSAVSADTDHGGMSDGFEDQDHNGVVNGTDTDPTAGHGADDGDNDKDHDGLPDDVELTLGTDPFDADSDDDGLMDGAEPSPAADTDSDGLIDALDPDSDDDGLFDGTEMGLPCEGPGTDATAAHCLADADLGQTTTDPRLADSDAGGVTDGDEDDNHDGLRQDGETDPNDPTDDAPECVDDAACGDANSGMTCDPATRKCVPGCSDEGNGCPDGEVCSDRPDGVGVCAVASKDVPRGCVCNIETASDDDPLESTWTLALSLIAALTFFTRRRK